MPAFNVRVVVDAEHKLIVARQVTDQAADNRSLQPMAETVQAAVWEINLVGRSRLIEWRTGVSLRGTRDFAAPACEP
jgi:hypothetical protein